MKGSIFCVKALLIFSLIASAANAGLLYVIQPSSLAETVEIKASLGNFGHITYGQTIMGKVIKAENENKFGCIPLTWGDFPTVYSTDTPGEV